MVNIVEKVVYLTNEVLREKDLTSGAVLEGIIKEHRYLYPTEYYYLYSIFDLTCFELKLEVSKYELTNRVHVFIPYYLDLDQNGLDVVDVCLYISFSPGEVEYREKRGVYERIVRKRGEIDEYINYPEFTEVYKVVIKSVLNHITYFTNCLKSGLLVKMFTTYPHLSETDVSKDVKKEIRKCSTFLKEMMSKVVSEVSKVAELLKITLYKVEEKENSVRVNIVFEKDGKRYGYSFAVWIEWVTPDIFLYIPESLEAAVSALEVHRTHLPYIIRKILKKKEGILNREIMKWVVFTLLAYFRYFK